MSETNVKVIQQPSPRVSVSAGVSAADLASAVSTLSASTAAAQATADAALPRAGGTLSGPLVLVADPTINLHAASKHYVDTLVADEGARAEAAEAKLNLGADWSDGERRSPYTADNPAPQKMQMLDGSTAAPSTIYGPTAVISRVLSVPESEFTGAGEAGLSALLVTATAIEGSQGQAIGATFAGMTYSSYEGAHSLADGIGSAHIGISRGTSTRTGQGQFVLGRRESATGRATATEIVIDNQAAAEEYTGVLPATKAIHLHAFGTADSAAGLVFNKPTTTTARMHTGIAFTTSNLVTSSSIRDDGNALWSLRIRGSHEKAAMSINAGAGPLLVGVEERNFAGSHLFEIYGGETAFDPLYVMGTGKGVSTSGILIRNSTGQMKAFAANAANAFLTGTAQGDTGINFTVGKTFHIGAQTKTSLLRVNETGVAVNGATPVARAAAIGVPAETLAGHQAAINSLREAVKNFGITL